MFDLGRTFLAAVERKSDTTAIADGKRRLSYAFWYEEIARVAGGLTALGLRHGDRWLADHWQTVSLPGPHDFHIEFGRPGLPR